MGGLFGGGHKAPAPVINTKAKEEEKRRNKEKRERRFNYGADMIVEDDELSLAGDTTLSNSSLLNIGGTLGG